MPAVANQKSATVGPLLANSLAVLDTTLKKFGTAAAKFLGTGLGSGMDFRTLLPVTFNDFTIECHFYWDGGTGNYALFSTFASGAGTEVYIGSGSVVKFYTGSSTIITGTTVVTTGAWHHVELSRVGSTIYLFLDGVLQGSASYSTTLTNHYVSFGQWWSGSEYLETFDGNIDEARITSIGRHTANFTAPSTEFGTDVGSDPDWDSVLGLYRFDAFEQPTVKKITPYPIEVHTSSSYAPVWKLAPPRPVFLKDWNYSGLGRIFGTVKEKDTPSNIPVHRRVRLYRDFDGQYVAETWSDATTGEYEFANIDMAHRYTVLTYDYEHDYRAVVADNLQPDLMT